MSNDVAIRVEGLGKCYRLGETLEHNTARDALVSGVGKLTRRLTGREAKAKRSHQGREMLWALKDCNFEVKKGEVLGIIGRNGAGKSTLLKVLSEITEPTQGRAIMRGRVGSLLEVGTGFHPELTGRENIFLNGAVLGMSRPEIKSKFDEIVAFAEVEKFLDTPVKRYSSGMQTRLGFAVAAHLEPEILIVDEVLAVGDAAFQKKCLGKMDDVAKSGRTVLFVSHNMAAVERLCTHCAYIKSGALDCHGDTIEIAMKYKVDVLTSDDNVSTGSVTRLIDSCGNVVIHTVVVCKSNGQSISVLQTGQDLSVVICVTSDQSRAVYVQVNFTDVFGNRVFSCRTLHADQSLNLLEGENEVTCTLPDVRLANGTYIVEVEVGDAVAGERYDRVVVEARVEIDIGMYLHGSKLLPGQGPLAQISRWAVKNLVT